MHDARSHAKNRFNTTQQEGVAYSLDYGMAGTNEAPGSHQMWILSRMMRI